MYTKDLGLINLIAVAKASLAGGNRTVVSTVRSPLKKGAGNFNAGRDEALSRFLWGMVEEMT